MVRCVSLAISIKTGVVVAVRNHDGKNATLAVGRVIVVLRATWHKHENKCEIRAETRNESAIYLSR